MPSEPTVFNIQKQADLIWIKYPESKIGQSIFKQTTT
jgi:hypothetical protein